MKNIVPFRRRGLFDLFDDLANLPMISGNFLDTNSFKIDVSETDSQYLVEAELPGVDKSEIKLRMDKGTLSIEIERSESSEKKEKNYIHKERAYSSMVRSLHLDQCDCDKVDATLEDGLLKIRVAKLTGDKKTKEIEIK